MASISKDMKGNITIQFVAGDSKRRSLRLGKVSQKVANEVKLKVENLNALAVANLPMDADTARWVADIGDDLHANLAAVCLLPSHQSATLEKFLSDYLPSRTSDGSKPATVVIVQRVIHDLTQLFGARIDLRAVTAAERFKQRYQKRELAGATVFHRLKMAKMLFGYAVKVKLLPINPFALVRSKNANPVERRRYVGEADTEKMLAVSKPQLRTIIALARYSGLRCPSEVLSLKWADMDLAAGRMTIPSPKTEHIEGKEYRVCPIFARLRPHLEDALELATPGEVYVVGGRQGRRTADAAAQKPGGWVTTNLRTTFEKIVRWAGLIAWPRLFQTLRASCETDQMQNHPIHVATAWIGNTPKIALGHDLQTLDADFEKAVKGGAESGAVRSRRERAGTSGAAGTP